MSKKTKRQKLESCHAAYEAAKTGSKPKRPTKKGMQTHPVVPCPDLPEAEVLKQSIKWLKARRIFCDRHDCGVGPGHARYGIKYAGDIVGILPDGRHLEIEVKRGRGGRLSAGQVERMHAVRAAGGEYLVVHGIAELEVYMEGLI